MLIDKLEHDKKMRENKKNEKIKSQEQMILKELNTLAQEKEIMKKAFDQEKKKQIEGRINVAQQIRVEREKHEQETKIVLKKILTNNNHIIRGTSQSARKSRDIVNNSINYPPVNNHKLKIPKNGHINKSLSIDRKVASAQKQQLPPLSSEKKSIKLNVTKKGSLPGDNSKLVNSIERMKGKIEYLESLVNDGSIKAKEIFD